MKRLFILLLLVSMTTLSYAADINDWQRGDSSEVVKGTDNASDIDADITNYLVDPLERILPGSIYGCTLTWATNATVTIGVGSVVCSNSAGTVHRIRKNTSTVTITIPASGASGDSLDDGNAAVSTWYHVYAVADADATTFTGVCSASASAPVGATYYRYLGSFYNNAADNIAVFYWVGKGTEYKYMWSVPISITTDLSAGAWSGAISLATGIPPTSRCALLAVNAYRAGAEAEIWVKPNGATWGTDRALGIGSEGGSEGQLLMMTDTSQQIQYYTIAGTTSCAIFVIGFVGER